jgi:hypothetical protein
MQIREYGPIGFLFPALYQIDPPEDTVGGVGEL